MLSKSKNLGSTASQVPEPELTANTFIMSSHSTNYCMGRQGLSKTNIAMSE